MPRRKWQQHQQCMSALALILGVQKKLIMLIQHTEKKENSSSERYEMSKLSFGDAILLVTDWKTAHATFHSRTVYYIYWNSWWRTNRCWTLYSVELFKPTFLYNLTLEIYANFPMCACYFLSLLLQTTAFAK